MKKLYFIEDDPSIRIIVQTFLAKSFDVTCFENALDALDALESSSKPDIIVTDISMPEMTGFELIQNIRSSLLLDDIPIIILSSKRNSEDRIKCLQSGADDFLVKPFNPEELKFRIQTVLKRYQGYASN